MAQRVPNMRSRRVVFVPDHKEFGEFMLSDQIRDPTAEAARDVVDIASGLAPRSNRPGPHMADQFKVNREAGVIKVSGNVRVKVEVYNEDPAAAPNEFGNGRTRRHRMLGRAGAEVGEFKPDGGPK